MFRKKPMGLFFTFIALFGTSRIKSFVSLEWKHLLFEELWRTLFKLDGLQPRHDVISCYTCQFFLKACTCNIVISNSRCSPCACPKSSVLPPVGSFSCLGALYSFALLTNVLDLISISNFLPYMPIFNFCLGLYLEGSSIHPWAGIFWICVICWGL